MGPDHEPDDNGLPPIDNVVIPDDARELERDVQAYRREQRWQRRRERWSRVLRVSGRYGAVTPFFAGLLLLVALSAVLLVFSAQPNQPGSSGAPGGVPHGLTPGAIGGPLPDIHVVVGATPRPLRELRPAALVLVPHGRDSEPLLDKLAGHARRYGIPLYLVESGPAAPDLEGLAGRVGGRQSPPVVEEPSGTLAQRYDASGVTAVLVNRDGKVSTVLRNLSVHDDFEDQLEPLTGSWNRSKPAGVQDAATASPG